MNVKNDWNEENKIFDRIDPIPFTSGKMVFKNCIIGLLSLHHISDELVIENCIINELVGTSTVYNGGCTIRNSVIKEGCFLWGGGHNKREMRIEENVFCCFVDFWDDVFEEHFVMVNNIFVMGTNLLGFKGELVQVTFEKGNTIEGNIGTLDLDESS